MTSAGLVRGRSHSSPPRYPPPSVTMTIYWSLAHRGQNFAKNYHIYHVTFMTTLSGRYDPHFRDNETNRKTINYPGQGLKLIC